MSNENEYRSYILGIVGETDGDDLERARAAFGHRTMKQMQENYGESGETCANILKGYEDRREKHLKAVAWLKTKI